MTISQKTSVVRRGIGRKTTSVVSSPGITLTRIVYITAWVKLINRSVNLVLGDNNITISSVSEGGSILCRIVTSVNQRQDAKCIAFQRINVDSNRIVQEGVALDGYLVIEGNCCIEGSDECADSFIVVTTVLKNCLLKERLFACNSVDLTVTDIEVTVGV